MFKGISFIINFNNFSKKIEPFITSDMKINTTDKGIILEAERNIEKEIKTSDIVYFEKYGQINVMILCKTLQNGTQLRAKISSEEDSIEDFGVYRTNSFLNYSTYRIYFEVPTIEEKTYSLIIQKLTSDKQIIDLGEVVFRR